MSQCGLKVTRPALTLQSAGFTVEELFGMKATGRKTKGVIKYRDPEDSTKTWTGKGRKPKWLVKALEEGKALEDFEI